MKLIFSVVLTLIFFSIWAGFALMVVNPYMSDQLPGYTIGRICIWEFIALAVAFVIVRFITNSWGFPERVIINDREKIVLNPSYGYFFLFYFLLAISVGIWQFWLFSQKF